MSFEFAVPMQTTGELMSIFVADFLAGKSALIAGGTSGIGLGIATALAQHGARVVLLGRDREKGESAAAKLRERGLDAIAVAADVRDYAAIEAALSDAGVYAQQLDIVVAGAAGNFRAPAAEMSANAFRTVVDIDLMGTFNIFRAVHARLRTPGAALLAISAGQSVAAIPLQAHACAAKAGVNMLVRTLALEWAGQGIRVNGVIPGPVAGTEGMARLLPAEQLEKYTASLPLKRFANADEIAAAALFLLSPAASYVTGACLSCDGGSLLGTASG